MTVTANRQDNPDDDRFAKTVVPHMTPYLMLADLPASDRQTMEDEIRTLASHADPVVRLVLTQTVKHIKTLPRDIALTIARDDDDVACQFLEVTQVFADDDWPSILPAVSRRAHIAVAGRSSMTETLALALIELSDTVIAESLLANPAAPITQRVHDALRSRFLSASWILDMLAMRRGPATTSGG